MATVEIKPQKCCSQAIEDGVVVDLMGNM